MGPLLPGSSKLWHVCIQWCETRMQAAPRLRQGWCLVAEGNVGGGATDGREAGGWLTSIGLVLHSVAGGPACCAGMPVTALQCACDSCCSA